MSQESQQQPESVTSPSVSPQAEAGKVKSPEKANLSFPKAQVVGVLRGTINLLKTAVAKIEATVVQEKTLELNDTPTPSADTQVRDADWDSDTAATTTKEVIDTDFSELETVGDTNTSESDTAATTIEEVINTELSALETTKSEVTSSETSPSQTAIPEETSTEFSEVETTTPEVTDSTTPELETITPEVIDTEIPQSPTTKTTPEVTDTEFSEVETTTPEVSGTQTPELETTQTVIQPTPNPVEKRSEEEAEVFSQPQTLSWMDRILPTFPKLQAWWDLVLDKIRSFLPVTVSEKLNDVVLTGIVTGLVVTILWISVALLPEPDAKVVDLPPSVVAPPQIKAPKKPQSVETLVPPPPKLTPEQSLIAAIQQQVGEITNNYAEGLIKSIQANFISGRLTVKVGDDWYQLTPEKQDSLAQEVLLRTQELNFAKLEIQDIQGTMVARNPVVGKQMVILLRQRLQ